MKRIYFLFVALFMLCNLYSQEADVKGIWYNTEKTSKIKIFKATNGKFYGKIVWLKNADKKDINNPDESKRDEPLMGLLFIKSFKYDESANQWVDGSIYDPNSGKTHDCYMWFEDGNKDILHVKGYVMGMRFAGKEVEWTRTTE